MFTVIIPTLWKNKRIFKLIDDLITSEKVGEILIINNDKEKTPDFKSENSKLKIITPDKNIYVNPSWNLGVKNSKYDYIALCNDDINFNSNIFSYLKPKDDSLIGLGEGCFKINFDEQYQLVENKKLTYGFGCLMFLNKQSYKMIPECLKIFCGDNFLHKNIKNVYSLRGLKVETEMSSSQTISGYHSITQQDKINFANLN